jgi:hypothetical protein
MEDGRSKHSRTQEKMTDPDSNVPKNITGLLFSLIFVGAGALILLGAVDIIHLDPEGLNAPRWVIGSVGASFFLIGLYMLVMMIAATLLSPSWTGQWLQNMLMIGFLISFILPFHWVAFGSGEREFTQRISIPFLSLSGSGSEITGRCAFAGFVVLIDLALLIGTISWIMRKLNKQSKLNNKTPLITSK